MPKKKLGLSEMEEMLAKEVAELNDQLVRERADAMNVRRRAEEDRAKLGSFYKSHVVKEILPFLDNLDRALKHMPVSQEQDNTDTKQFTEWAKGIESINKQLVAALEKIGVERIKTVGERFNPTLHEAVTMEEGDGAEEIVSEELQSGYKLQDEVIRHAMVRVRLQ